MDIVTEISIAKLISENEAVHDIATQTRNMNALQLTIDIRLAIRKFLKIERKK